jgi:hypothetical protein
VNFRFYAPIQTEVNVGQLGINVPIPVPLPMFSWSGNKVSAAVLCLVRYPDLARRTASWEISISTAKGIVLALLIVLDADHSQRDQLLHTKQGK